MYDINALIEERRGYVVRGLKDRVAQVDALLGQADYVPAPEAPAIEEAANPVEVETAVKRGPGRPRKAV